MPLPFIFVEDAKFQHVPGTQMDLRKLFVGVRKVVVSGVLNRFFCAKSGRYIGVAFSIIRPTTATPTEQ
jgi:hypothetical protein